MAQERDLRKWLRSAWGKRGISWVEAAPGGTPGIPDCMLDLPGRSTVPVELKWWDVDSKGRLECKVRPAQRRYHLIAAMQQRKTAFLVAFFAWELDDISFVQGLSQTKNKDELCYAMFPGSLVPLTAFPSNGPPPMVQVTNGDEVERWLRDDAFWSMGQRHWLKGL
jgi:hypothetical protein